MILVPPAEEAAIVNTLHATSPFTRWDLLATIKMFGAPADQAITVPPVNTHCANILAAIARRVVDAALPTTIQEPSREA